VPRAARHNTVCVQSYASGENRQSTTHYHHVHAHGRTGHGSTWCFRTAEGRGQGRAEQENGESARAMQHHSHLAFAGAATQPPTTIAPIPTHYYGLRTTSSHITALLSSRNLPPAPARAPPHTRTMFAGYCWRHHAQSRIPDACRAYCYALPSRTAGANDMAPLLPLYLFCLGTQDAAATALRLQLAFFPHLPVGMPAHATGDANNVTTHAFLT